MIAVRKFNISFRLRLIVWGVAITTLITLLSFSLRRQREMRCVDINISVNHKEDIFFLDEKDISVLLSKGGYDSMAGKQLSQINYSAIEDRLEQNPFIKRAEVFVATMDVVKVRVEQKAPVMRIINKSHVSYYLDQFGAVIPTSGKFTPRVPVATGFIPPLNDTKADSMHRELLRILFFINDDKFWKAQVEQVYVNADREFELIPKFGHYYLLIGDATDLESKFDRLMTFYKQIVLQTETGNYKTVNVKFKNQIICTKI